MTRKCVICKKTNYRNGSSFFSAPKDPETRKLWQDAIGIENYVVKDDTYVCSKHFYSTDIITHWFSGVPPHVITIKYKKFRLRPGAIPKIEIDPEDKDLEFLECDTEFEVNRSVSPISDPLLPPSSRSRETFSIPRTDTNPHQVEAKLVDLEDLESVNYFENDLASFSPPHESQMIQTNYNLTSDKMTQEDFEEDEILNGQNSIEEINEFGEEQVEVEAAEVEAMEALDSDDSAFKSSSNLNRETMLFEDLLEIYTEVSLPKGWSSSVIPRGHGTTVVFSLTKINKSGIPVVEKQVFLKANMILRCSVRSRSLDPMMHNLIREQRNLKVQTLMDVEELIDEFNKRQICDGNPSRNLVNIEAFYEGTNWRHASCPLIVNNGLSKCSKCASLTSSRKRKSSALTESTYSVRKSRFVERQQTTIKSLEKSVVSERFKSNNCQPDRLSPSPLPPKTVGLLSETVDLLRIPKIQKLMMKECLKLESYGDENVAKFSRSWIFLCLLLHRESPEMYKYMLLNKFMNLPPLSIVRRYLSRIKTDREFSNIFQKTVKQFQVTEEASAAKTK
ncbi:uncharacterized protein LOC117174621 [Belonocnema kinseyi]|uniref:uncharacterized protein LOC117174621 n=1 Tax=Belonocnema kinseyi TaxID=2817044 RepID=UPI00143D720F|nr:uncharacterized protein LOC117174621 [Belonocnema kinseyi]